MMVPVKTVTVPPRRGMAIPVPAGSSFEVVNVHGGQVVDMWALAGPRLERRLSMEHTRTVHSRLTLKVGDLLFDDLRQPLLELTADTSPGVHDMLIAACDPVRYEMLGYEGRHDNCSDNFRMALTDLGHEPPGVPSPLNLFMNIPWSEEGGLGFEQSPAEAGDMVRFRAEESLILVLSSCPQDMVPISGENMTPREVEVRLI